MATLYAGTSGFAYAAWKPAFYPPKLPANQFLKHYAERLNCVEINYTFRRLPSASTLEAWVKLTPPGFVFAVKANMRITHILRLKNAEQATDIFLKAIDPLRSSRRLGPILFQLPPHMKYDLDLLRNYLGCCRKNYGTRSSSATSPGSWMPFTRSCRAGMWRCAWPESEKLEVPEVITADFVYYRLRKPDYTGAGRKRVSPIGPRSCWRAAGTFI